MADPINNNPPATLPNLSGFGELNKKETRDTAPALKGFSITPLQATLESNGKDQSSAEIRRLIEDGRATFRQHANIFCPDERGRKLITNLKNNLSDFKLGPNDLVIVLVGSGHMGQAHIDLVNSFNTHFYSESGREGIPANDFMFKAAVRCSAKESQSSRDYDPDKPNLLIYGDYHSLDYNFTADFPRPEDLKKSGVKRVFFAGEHFPQDEPLALDQLEMASIPSYARFRDYLRESKKIGLETQVIGLEYVK